MRHTLSLAFGLLIAIAQAQPGTNDPTFNPGDDGTWGDGVKGEVRDMVQQPDGKLVLVGWIGQVHTTAMAGIVRMGLDGTIDPLFDAGTGFPLEAGAVPRVIVRQPDGRFLVGGSFMAYGGSIRNNIVRILPDGAVDPSFDAGAGPNGTVRSIAVLPDGRILIAGDFLTVQGAFRPRMARLLADGSLDGSFVPGSGPDGPVHCMHLGPDGRIVIGGAFSTVQGLTRSCIARLEANGTLDSTFDPGAGAQGMAPLVGAGPFVNTLCVTDDGQVVIGGSFAQFDGVARHSIARLDADGGLDALFDGAGGTDNEITSCDQRGDGRILIGGLFFDFAGRAGLVQLMPDGAADPTFYPAVHTNSVLAVKALEDDRCMVGGSFRNVGSVPAIASFELLEADGSVYWPFHRGSGANNFVDDLLVLPDNSILMAGYFSRYNGEAARWMVRMLPDGERDPDWPAGTGPNGRVRGMVRLADGRLYIHGDFSSVDGVPRQRLARLLPNGHVDPTFDAGTGVEPSDFGVIRDIAAMDNGRLLIAGTFTTVQGTPRNGIARLFFSGELEPNFYPQLLFDEGEPMVNAVEVSPAPDNRIWIGGDFSSVNGTPRRNLARLLTAGTLDLAFDPGGGPQDGSFIRLTRTPTDELLVYGGIDAYDGTVVDCSLVRVLANGSLDPAFTPPVIPCIASFPGTGPASCRVNEVIQLPTGQIVLGGRFVMEGDDTWNAVASLLPNGLLDPPFADVTITRGTEVMALGFQPNCCAGKLLIGGEFTAYDDAVRHRVARLRNDGGVRMLGRVFLEGPWAGDLMEAALAPAGLLPDTEPYTGLGFAHISGGGEQAHEGVFQQQGGQAIVDWIFLELRNAQLPSQVFATRSALLRADGAIVDMDGLSSVEFKDVGTGIYHVAVRHRNHFGAMTGQPVFLSYSGGFFDLTSASTPVYGNEGIKEMWAYRMLWAGDVSGDGTLRYTGQDNDRDLILTAIGGAVPTNVVAGYRPEDVNMDGLVKYIGEHNDRDPILQNVGGSVPTNTRQEQLP